MGRKLKLPLLLLQLTVQEREQGGFSCTIAANQSNFFTGIDGHIHPGHQSAHTSS